MKSTFSVIYYLKRQVVKKDGTVPVMGRITVDGSQTQFSCKLTVDPKLWDTKGGRVTGRSTAALETNRMLDKMRVRINRHYQEIMERDNYVTAEKVKILQEADWVLRDEMKKNGYEREMAQFFCVLPGVSTVGVMGDHRTYDHLIAIRAVTTDDFMTADWAKIRLYSAGVSVARDSFFKESRSGDGSKADSQVGVANRFHGQTIWHVSQPYSRFPKQAACSAVQSPRCSMVK